METTTQKMEAAKAIIMPTLQAKAKLLGLDENLLFVASFILGVNHNHTDLYKEHLNFDTLITNNYLELMISDLKRQFEEAVQEHGTLRALDAARHLKRLSPAELESDTERNMLYFAFDDFIHGLNEGRKEVYSYQLEVMSKGLAEVRKLKALYHTSLTETVLILCKDEVQKAADTRLMIQTGFTKEDMINALTH